MVTVVLRPDRSDGATPYWNTNHDATRTFDQGSSIVGDDDLVDSSSLLQPVPQHQAWDGGFTPFNA